MDTCTDCGGRVDLDTKAPLDTADGLPVAGMRLVEVIPGGGLRDVGFVHLLCNTGA